MHQLVREALSRYPVKRRLFCHRIQTTIGLSRVPPARALEFTRSILSSLRRRLLWVRPDCKEIGYPTVLHAAARLLFSCSSPLENVFIATALARCSRRAV